MKNTKLIFCMNLMPDSLGGIELWCKNLGSFLAQYGYQVVIVADTYPGSSRTHLHHALTRLSMMSDKIDTITNLDYKVLPEKKFRMSFWKNILDNDKCIIFPNECEEIWSNCAELVKMGKKIKIGSVIHTDNPYVYQIIKQYHHLFKRCIAVSNDILKNLQVTIPVDKRIMVIPYGIDCKDVFPIIKINNKLVITYVGRLYDPHKGIFLLPDIISQLVKHDFDIKVNVIGSGPDKPELVGLIQKLELENLFIFHGQLSQEKVYEVLERSHIFLQPSYREGISISLLEAMGRGCIPVVTPVSGTKDAILHGFNGFISKSRNAQEIANYCLLIAKDETRFTTMSKNAWDTAIKKFTWESYLNTFEDFLQQIHEDPYSTWPPNLDCFGRKTYSLPRIALNKIKKHTVSFCKGFSLL